MRGPPAAGGRAPYNKEMSRVSVRLEQQKQEKKQSLLDAAYALFTEKGITKTSVDEIVRGANVAKGTFYLYFHDKTDVLQDLIYKTSYRVLTEAHASVSANSSGDFVEDVILLVDYVIEYFKHNKLTLRLLERNFSWPIMAQQLAEPTDPLWTSFAESLKTSPLAGRYSSEEMFRLIYIIIDMCGSVCYSSIIEHKPDTIDNMKPVLYGIIRKILQ